jgi:hypothetical protein
MSIVMEPTTSAEAVANGAQLLDEKRPGWWREIDVDRLAIGSMERCVCGQLTRRDGNTSWAAFCFTELGVNPPARKYGFAEWPGRGDVNEEWRLVIQARLDADALSSPTERKEVCV